MTTAQREGQHFVIPAPFLSSGNRGRHTGHTAFAPRDTIPSYTSRGLINDNHHPCIRTRKAGSTNWVQKDKMLTNQNSSRNKALYSAGLDSCGLTSWFSVESLCLLDPTQSILAGSEYNEAQLVTRRELSARLRRDREIWVSFCASQINCVLAMENSHKLFHFIRDSGRKALNMSKTICEADGPPTWNQQRRLVR